MRRRSKRSIFIATSFEPAEVKMLGTARIIQRIVSLLFGFHALCLLVQAQPVLALEDVLIPYAGPIITFLPVEVARQRGFFREQNLDVKLILTRTEVDRAALASGNINYSLRAGSSFVSAARGLPVGIVFLGTTKPFWGLVVRPEIKSVSELKGKSMGVPGLLGSQQISAKFILKQSGLDPDRDVIYRIVDTGTRIGAMLSGSIDCAMMDYGEAFRAKKLGLKLLVNAAEYHGLLAGRLRLHSRKPHHPPPPGPRLTTALLQ